MWRMELRHLTMNAHLGSINICAYRGLRFLYVDQSSPRLLENFGEDIPTSPEVTKAHTLIFKPNFKIFVIKFSFFGGGIPVPVRGMLGSLGRSLVR